MLIPRPTAHFQGRTRELETLRGALARHPVAIICGIAGIGKTTLALRLARDLAPAAHPIWTRVSETGGGDRWLVDLAQTLHVDWPDRADPAARAQILLGALETRGATLLVDDLHLADDPAGKALVGAFLDFAQAARLIATSREAPDLAPSQRAEVFLLTLSGLADHETRALVDSLMGARAADLAGRAATAIFRRTRGHPQFVRHLTERVIEGGLSLEALDTAGGTSRELADFLDREVLGSLGTRERAVLAVLAVLAEPAPLDLVARACERAGQRASERAPRDWARVVARLERRGLIERGPGLTRGLHAQIGEAVLRNLPDALRASVEGLVGEALLAMPDDGSEPWIAVRLSGYAHLVRSGRAAGVAREIGPLLERAHSAALVGEVLAVLDALAERLGRLPGDLAVARARALKVRGRTALALGALEPGAPPRDRNMRMRMCSERGDIHAVAGNYARARAEFTRALALARALGEPGAMVDGLNDLASICFYEGKVARARVLGQRALEEARAIGDAPREAVALNNLAAATRHAGRLAEAHALYRECLAIDGRLGEATGSASTLHNLGVVAMLLDRPDEALAALGRSARLKERLGARGSLANTLRHMAEVALSTLDLDTAQAHVDRARALLGKSDRVMAAYVAGTEAMIALESDDPARADSLLDRALGMVAGRGAARVTLGLWRKKAEVALARGGAPAARVALRRALAAARSIDDSMELVAVHRLSAQASLMVGAPRRARASLDRARRLLAREGMGGERGWIEVLAHLLAAPSSGLPRVQVLALEGLAARLTRAGLLEPALAARYTLVGSARTDGSGEDAQVPRLALLEAARAVPLRRLAALESLLAAMGRAPEPLFEIVGPDGVQPAGAGDVRVALDAGRSAGLVLDLFVGRLCVKSVPVEGFLARKVQGALLAALMRAGRRGATKATLYQEAWKTRYNPEIHDNTVYVRINHLRTLLRPLLGTDPIAVDTERSTYRIAPGVPYLLIAGR